VLICRYAFFVCAVTGYIDFLQCRQKRVFELNRCPYGSTIYIRSATVGFTRSRSPCQRSTDWYYRCRTYHDEIMSCNGHRHCSIGPRVFNQRCWWWPRSLTANSIHIEYNCVNGKRLRFVLSAIRNHTLKDITVACSGHTGRVGREMPRGPRALAAHQQHQNYLYPSGPTVCRKVQTSK